MKVAVESWEPEYGSPVESGEMEEPITPSDLEVELPVGEWNPIAPENDIAQPTTIQFVDGVRRIDAHLWITTDEGITKSGICASYAAGIVRCEAATAKFIDAKIRRAIISTSGAPALDTPVGYFQPYAAKDDSTDQLTNKLLGQMGDLEVEVASHNNSGDAIMILDGPLSMGRHRIPGAVGYIKTHRVSYLPSDLTDVVSKLKVGERTPIFLTGTTWSRYSWYVRLPSKEGHPWSGVVRCEMSSEGEVPKIRHLADQLAAMLPMFASESHKESRAPQNLYPIAALERELHRRLGHFHLIDREIRVACARL